MKEVNLLNSIVNLIKFLVDKEQFEVDFNYEASFQNDKHIHLRKRYIPELNQVLHVSIELHDHNRSLCVIGNSTIERNFLFYQFKNEENLYINKGVEEFETLSDYFFDEVGKEFQELIEIVRLDLI